MDAKDLLHERLREQEYFVTEPRETVIDYLLEIEHPVTIDEVAGALKTRGVNRSSVYRTINLFEELGVVEKVLFRDGITRVELSPEFGGTHHHHLVCHECEKVIEFEECGLQNLQRIADIKHGFTVESHYMEFYGLCRDCREASSKQTA